MRYEHELSNEAEDDLNSNSMIGYRYLVGVKDATMEWISPSYRKKLKQIVDISTTGKIWKCEGRLLSSTGVDRDGRLKDTCFSFAMFWLLLRRYAGYSLYERTHDKTWRFVRDHLFSGSGSKDNDDDFGVERAFRVIEVQLLSVELVYMNVRDTKEVGPALHHHDVLLDCNSDVVQCGCYTRG
ncbi:hypothetical protein Ancab_034006 [Ancistrocladus abbreviatus]